MNTKVTTNTHKNVYLLKINTALKFRVLIFSPIYAILKKITVISQILY